MFAPAAAEVYPGGTPQVTVDPGPLGDQLEGAVRPGHFAGVLTVVAKLLGLVRPDVGIFGEKDYQQLTLIRRMVADLELGVRIDGAPTVRDPDGLALSSRNRFLDPAEREQALALSRALRAGAGRHTAAAVLAAAAERGLHEHVWRLSAQFTSFLDRDGRWEELLVFAGTGLAACERLGDDLGVARCRRALGRANTGLRRWDAAEEDLRTAMDFLGRAGERVEQGWAAFTIGNTYGFQRKYDLAIEAGGVALGIFREIGHRVGQAAAHNLIGWYETERGDHREALVSCRTALEIFEEVGDTHGQAITWDSLGRAHRHLGELDSAARCYRRAVELHRADTSRPFRADSLVSLGDVQAALGDAAAAERSWRDGLEILEDMDHPDAAGVRERLAAPAVQGLIGPASRAR